MSRVNFVHGLYDHDLRGFAYVSSFTREKPVLQVLHHGENYSENSVRPVKVDGKKDSPYNPYRKNTVHVFYERATVEFWFHYIVKTVVRVFGHVVGRKFMRGGER